METLSVSLLFKAFLRVLPVALLFKVPLEVSVLGRILFSVPLTLILSQRLAQNQLSAMPESWGAEDLLIGLAVGVFLNLFLSAAMKASLFFSKDQDEEDPWRKVIDSFLFIFILMLFMALNLERSVIEVLAVDSASATRVKGIEFWSLLLTDISWLALKVSSFGLVFVLTKSLFEEIYFRIGGESLKLIFSICTWVLLLVMSPFIIPSFADFVSTEMSELWRKWMGV